MVSKIVGPVKGISSLFSDKLGDLYEAITVEDETPEGMSIGESAQHALSRLFTGGGEEFFKATGLPNDRALNPVGGIKRLLGVLPEPVERPAEFAVDAATDPLNVLTGAGVARHGVRIGQALRGVNTAPISQLLRQRQFGQAGIQAARRGAANLVEPITTSSPGRAFAAETGLGVAAETTTRELQARGVDTPLALGGGLAAGGLAVVAPEFIRRAVREGAREAMLKTTTRPGTGPRVGMFETSFSGEDILVHDPWSEELYLERGRLKPLDLILMDYRKDIIPEFEHIVNDIMYQPLSERAPYGGTHYNATGVEFPEAVDKFVHAWSGMSSDALRRVISEGTEQGRVLYQHGEPLREWLRSVSDDGKTITLYRGENQFIHSYIGNRQKVRDELLARGVPASQLDVYLDEVVQDRFDSVRNNPQVLQGYTLDPDVASLGEFGGATGHYTVSGQFPAVKVGESKATALIERQVAIDDIVTALPDYNMKERELLVMTRSAMEPEALTRILSKTPIEDLSKYEFKDLTLKDVMFDIELFSIYHYIKNGVPFPEWSHAAQNIWHKLSFDNMKFMLGLDYDNAPVFDNVNYVKQLNNEVKEFIQNKIPFSNWPKAVKQHWDALSPGVKDQYLNNNFPDDVLPPKKSTGGPVPFHAGLTEDNFSKLANYFDNLDPLAQERLLDIIAQMTKSEFNGPYGISNAHSKFWEEELVDADRKFIRDLLDKNDMDLLQYNALGVVEGSGDARVNIGGVGSAQQREQLERDERRQEIRARLDKLAPKDLIREALEYGLELTDDMEQLKDTLSTYIFQGLEEPPNPTQILIEYENTFKQVPLEQLRQTAATRGVEGETHDELVTGLIDSFICEAGFEPEAIRSLSNPSRANFTDITLTKPPLRAQEALQSLGQTLEETQLPPSFQRLSDELARSYPYTDFPPEERFASTRPMFGSEGSGNSGAPPPPSGGTQPPLGNMPPPPKKPSGISDPLVIFNIALKTLWASADASWFGIQGMLPLARLATTGASKEAKDVIVNALYTTLDKNHIEEMFARHNQVWTQVDPRLNLQWLHDKGLNLASRGDPSDLPGLSALENLPIISHGQRLFHGAGDLGRLATVLNEYQLRGGTRLTDEQLIQIIKSANRITGYSDKQLFGQSSGLIMFAPRFFTAQLETITKAFLDGSIEGDIARRSLISAIGIGATLTFGYNVISGNFDPSMFDPGDSNFMRLRNVGGRDISIFGPWDSLVRGFARIVENPKEGTSFFVRSKASPIISAAWDLFSGEDFLGRPIDEKNWLLSFALPFAYKDMADLPLWAVPLSTLGIKSSPQTPSEILESNMERAGLDPNDSLARRRWMAEHPEDRPKGTRSDDIYRDAVRDDIRARSAMNDQRALTNQITLTEWRESRKNLLREQRVALNVLMRGRDFGSPRNQKEAWIDSYFNLLNESVDPVTQDIVSEQFDEALVEWISINGEQAYRYVQDYLLVGRSPLETAYLNDLNQLKSLNYFNMSRFRGMSSGLPDQTIADLRRTVSAERALDPRLAELSFQQAAFIVLRGMPMAVRRDVGNAGLQQFQNPAIARLEARYPHLVAWFNPNFSYEHYARISGSPTNPAAMLSIEQQQLLEGTNVSQQ